MKKYFTLFLIVIGTSLLLTGCNKDDNDADAEEWNDLLRKSQIIEVVSPEVSDITTITDSKEIKSFVAKLKIDKWKLEELPADAKKEREYVMYQKDNIHLRSEEHTSELQSRGNL